MSTERDNDRNVLITLGVAGLLAVVFVVDFFTRHGLADKGVPARSFRAADYVCVTSEAVRDDFIAKGANIYTETVKEAQAVVNLVISGEEVVEMVRF